MTSSDPLLLVRDWTQALAVVTYAACQLGLTVFSAHRWSLLLRRPGRPGPSPPWLEPTSWPRVTVQLPVYNERCIVERLIDAAAALDYPADRLEIQVLDDSDDETVGHAARAVVRHRLRGVDIQHVRRSTRDGFKAGALAAGLARAKGEWIAVFDADFAPPPDFLRRMARHFSDPGVGMVQACWGHLNRDQSLLTAAQAVMLDAHFLLEHAVRMRRGLFFNFNGTAGVWRRACIEDAGGWSRDTLTEDLDLSYRAQLSGWRFVFDPSIVVPAELPADMQAFKTQQRRWTRGSIQTARKILPAVFASRLPWPVKVEAALHLTSNAAYPMLLVLGLMLLPVLLGRSLLAVPAVWALQCAVLLLGIVPVTLFLARGQSAAGRRGAVVVRDVLAALVLGVGLSVNNARAVFEGLGSQVGTFERTPKTGEVHARARARRAYPTAYGLAGRGELALALYFVAVLPWLCGAHQWCALPFVVLLATGYAWVARGSLQARRA